MKNIIKMKRCKNRHPTYGMRCTREFGHKGQCKGNPKDIQDVVDDAY